MSAQWSLLLVTDLLLERLQMTADIILSEQTHFSLSILSLFFIVFLFEKDFIIFYLTR